MNTIKIGATTIASLALATILAPSTLAASVSPRGVNVSSFNATTVFLTYLGLNNQAPAEGIWCGAINADQSCVSGTIFGRLPQRSFFGRFSGQNNFTDIMTIPPSIARKAYQDAARGNNSDFFYVRRLVSQNGGADEFVAVTCRLAAGGARVPLSITNVRYQLADNKPAPPVTTAETLPKFGAQISYNGTGRLKGRWEVVRPGDPPPSPRDLLSEASLPLEERGLQRRYTVLQRFDVSLQPMGKIWLPGPDPATLPKGATGPHAILLRIEATDDREADSNIGTGIVNSGGVAGFPMPIFRYYMTGATNRNQTVSKLALLEPKPNTQLSLQAPIRFSWRPVVGANGYKLEIKDKERVIVSALLSVDRTTYNAPPWLKDNKGKSLTWQIQALTTNGKVLSESVPQEFRILGK